ncbi:hypothetical protein [Pseudomonas veronii]|nr:hypothetical protein [Pseudomonas veronii]WKC46933.1 hypothetical protein QYP03_00385 [Pseudomonas veronii]
MLDEEKIEFLGSIEFGPVIFQERIDKLVELRVTVVGDDIFSAEIHSQ